MSGDAFLTEPAGRAGRAVHDAVRASVPRMDIDREVAGQLAVVDALLPQLCRVAADGFPSFQ